MLDSPAQQRESLVRRNQSDLFISKYDVCLSVPHPCRFCPKSFTSKELLDVHYKTHLQMICDKCDKHFGCARELDKHKALRCYHKAVDYKCDLCPEVFSDKTNIRSHVTSHRRYPHRCKICKLYFDCYTKLIFHQSQCTRKRPFGCLKCKRFIMTKDRLKKHYRSVHRVYDEEELNQLVVNCRVAND